MYPTLFPHIWPHSTFINDFSPNTCFPSQSQVTVTLCGVCISSRRHRASARILGQVQSDSTHKKLEKQEVGASWCPRVYISSNIELRRSKSAIQSIALSHCGDGAYRYARLMEDSRHQSNKPTDRQTGTQSKQIDRQKPQIGFRKPTGHWGI